MDALTWTELHRLFEYSPDSGEFTRKVRVARRVREGDRAGALNAEGYRYIKIRGRAYKANRLAWFYVHGAWPAGQVDHINGKKGDDRICNLRDCTNAENSQNRTNPKGVYRSSDGRMFTSVVTISGKRHYLGRFKTPGEARAAYVEAKSKLHPFQNAKSLCA